MNICASPKAAEIIRRPNAVETITQLSDEVKGLLDSRGETDPAMKIPFEPFEQANYVNSQLMNIFTF